MIKRLFILFWVSAAFTIVLAHGFIPHAHGDEVVSQHHHDDDHGHDHDHEKDHEKDHDPEDIFQFFQHNEVTGNSFIPVKKFEYSIHKTLFTHPLFIVALFQLPDIEGPPLTLYNKGSDLFILPKANAYFFLLKAPPAEISLG